MGDTQTNSGEEYEENAEYGDDIVEVHYEERLTKNEIVLKDYNKAAAIQKILIEEGYCVMLSMEEQFYVLNYVETYEDEFFPRGEVYFNHVEKLEVDDMEG